MREARKEIRLFGFSMLVISVSTLNYSFQFSSSRGLRSKSLILEQLNFQERRSVRSKFIS